VTFEIRRSAGLGLSTGVELTCGTVVQAPQHQSTRDEGSRSVQEQVQE
jgi:hypothetical protein